MGDAGRQQRAALTGPAADGMTVSIPGVPLSSLRGDGARFVGRFGRLIGGRPDVYAVYAAEATEVLLDAIRRSDGTRRSIVSALFATHVRNGLLGSFAFTPQGDITRRAITTYRVTNGALRLWRVDEPPAKLVGDG